ncbi:MAG: hypothetical protein LC799_18955, partial [Actinobacteria bacterium]|nr:hypothetical protein [Actinomycetota bacterium]
DGPGWGQVPDVTALANLHQARGPGLSCVEPSGRSSGWRPTAHLCYRRRYVVQGYPGDLPARRGRSSVLNSRGAVAGLRNC